MYDTPFEDVKKQLVSGFYVFPSTGPMLSFDHRKKVSLWTPFCQLTLRDYSVKAATMNTRRMILKAPLRHYILLEPIRCVLFRIAVYSLTDHHTVVQSWSTLLIFILAMVVHPSVQTKAHEELDRVIGTDRLPEFEDRERLPYLECVVQEVYRWHNAVPSGTSFTTPYYTLRM